MTPEPLNYAGPTSAGVRTHQHGLAGAIRLVAFAIVVLAGAILAGLGAMAVSQSIYGAQAFSTGCFMIGMGSVLMVVQLILTLLGKFE